MPASLQLTTPQRRCLESSSRSLLYTHASTAHAKTISHSTKVEELNLLYRESRTFMHNRLESGQPSSWLFRQHNSSLFCNFSPVFAKELHAPKAETLFFKLTAWQKATSRGRNRSQSLHDVYSKGTWRWFVFNFRVKLSSDSPLLRRVYYWQIK